MRQKTSKTMGNGGDAETEIRDLRSAAGPQKGYTLLELVITLTVISVLVLGTIPLAQNAVKRQKEARLRETLRMFRNAIDEFKRDTLGACPQGAITTTNPTQAGNNVPADPRSRVVIDDCKIFTADNLDRYPPDLETLVKGIKVKPRGLPVKQNSVFDDKNATDITENKDVIKIYLRGETDGAVPVDPMTGKPDWKIHSCYQTADSGSWDQINVFDVRSNSNEEGLNGEKYSDW